MPTVYQGWGREYDLAWDRWKRHMGMEPRWSWGAVQSFRAIAAEGTAIELPSDPYLRSDESAHPGQRRFSKEVTYWTALHALLTCRLGWDRPGLGLLRTLEVPEVQDETLDLVRRLWLADGHIDKYVECSATRSGVAAEGMNDPFHFDDHVRRCWLDYDETILIASFDVREPTRRATLTFEMGHGWAATLDRRCGMLPDDNERSWWVDVYVKPIGFMGTYRKSRVTGRWFTGKHSVHMLGNEG